MVVRDGFARHGPARHATQGAQSPLGGKRAVRTRGGWARTPRPRMPSGGRAYPTPFPFRAGARPPPGAIDPAPDDREPPTLLRHGSQPPVIIQGAEVDD